MAAPSKKRRGAQPSRMRCDAAASRCPRHAGTGRCRSGTKAAHKHPMPVVESSVLMAVRPQAPRSTYCGRVYSALALIKDSGVGLAACFYPDAWCCGAPDLHK